jgi:4-hydroxybenzoate polyprenyltransferase
MTPTSEETIAVSGTRRSWVALLPRQLRLYQWAKNALVFIPLLGAHRLSDRNLVLRNVLAFFCFGLVASGVYVLNDLRDLEADRHHPRKRFRPLASGAMPIAVGKALAATLLFAGAILAMQLPKEFRFVLAGYWAATLGYSLGLKKRPILDVGILAGLYTVRMYAGSAATAIPVSEWLASFAMFLFLSLAFIKRAAELVAAGEALPGRGYRPVDEGPIFTMGIASGYLSVLVLALYVSSQDVRRLYAHPAWLWLLCPLVLFWISELWLRARRGEVDDDPLIFALRKRSSWIVLALATAVVWFGI